MSKSSDKDHAQEVAVFRSEIIGSLRHRALSRGELKQELPIANPVNTQRSVFGGFAHDKPLVVGTEIGAVGSHRQGHCTGRDFGDPLSGAKIPEIDQPLRFHVTAGGGTAGLILNRGEPPVRADQ